MKLKMKKKNHIAILYTGTSIQFTFFFVNFSRFLHAARRIG